MAMDTMNARFRTVKLVLAGAALAVAGLVTVPVVAGGKHHGERWSQMSEQEKLEAIEKRLDKRMARMKDKLGLSDKQVKEIRPILDGKVAEMRDARQRAGDRKAARKEVRKIRGELRAAVEAKLTPAQKTTFKAMKGKHKGKRWGKHKRRGKRMARMKRELGLSDAQATKMKEIREKTRVANKALIAKAGGDREAVRPQLKANRKAAKKEMFALLTPAQQAKFKAMKARHKGERKGRRGPRHNKGEGAAKAQ